jgi:CubicO group peptidase (beta-lactamase class C family)
MFVLCLAIQPVWSAAHGKPRAGRGLRNRLDSDLTRMTRRGYSGAALVARDGQIILHKAYGLADRERGVRNTTDTLFAVASITKVFTAAAIHTLEMQGKLSTGDLVSKYLGPFPGEKSGARIHHLLTHTSGLVVKGAELDYSSREAFVKSVKETPAAAKPGAEYQYLNAGYGLLAAVIEVASGVPYEEYLRQNLFDPGGMNSTGFAWEPRLGGAPVAIGYVGETLASLKPAPRAPDNWDNRGPSGLVTTVGDLYKWIQALSANSVLSPEAKRKMFTAYVGDEGYGWHVVKTARGGTLVHRGGGLPEAESELHWYIDERTVPAFTVNNHIGFRKPVLAAFRRALRLP